MRIIWNEASGSPAAEPAEIYLAFHMVFSACSKSSQQRTATNGGK
jgi:hypothetical protein